MKQTKRSLVVILVIVAVLVTCLGITVSPLRSETTNAAGTIPALEPTSLNIQAISISNSTDEIKQFNRPTISHEFTDPYFDKQWALQKILSLPLQSSQSKTIVAILDTGIDTNHEDLAGKIIASINFADNGTATDRNGHGTHIAGIIAASTNNGKGIASTGSTQHLLNVKVASDDGMVWPSNIAKGITWAVDQGAQVINASLCVPSQFSALQQAIEYAWSKGTVVVASAGNQASSTPSYPAAYPHVISVGAMDINNVAWEKSNYGSWIQLYSPGVGIYSTLPGNKYGYMSGTSMATAYVSSIAAQCFNQVSDQNSDGKVNDELAILLKELFSELK